MRGSTSAAVTAVRLPGTTPPKPEGHRSTLSSEASEAYAFADGGGHPSGSGREGGSMATERGGSAFSAARARLASTDSDAPGAVHPPLTPPPLGDAGSTGGGEALTTAGDDGGGAGAGAGLAATVRSVRWVDADGGAALAAVREFEASEDGDGSAGSGGGGMAGSGPHPACCSLM